METDNKFLNFISAFIANSESRCGENLGNIEPVDYPGDYIIDGKKAVIDLEDNTTHYE